MKKSFLHKTLLALGVFGIAMAGSHLVLAQTIQRVTDEYLSTTLELRPKDPTLALPPNNWGDTNMHLVGSAAFDSITASGESDLENLLVGDPNVVQSADTAVMLSGAMRIESLSDPIGTSGVCVDDFGVLTRCPGGGATATSGPAQCKPYSGVSYTQQAQDSVTGCTSGHYFDRTDDTNTFKWGCRSIDDSIAATPSDPSDVMCSHGRDTSPQPQGPGGLAVSDPSSAPCGPMVDSRTGETYEAEMLGGKCWTKRNLGFYHTLPSALYDELNSKNFIGDTEKIQFQNQEAYTQYYLSQNPPTPSYSPAALAAAIQSSKNNNETFFEDVPNLVNKCTTNLPSGHSLLYIIIYGHQDPLYSSGTQPLFKYSCFSSASLPSYFEEDYFGPVNANDYPSSVIEHEICPTGWRLPTDEEWRLAEADMGMTPSTNILKLSEQFSWDSGYPYQTFTATNNPTSYGRKINYDNQRLVDMNFMTVEPVTYLTKDHSKKSNGDIFSLSRHKQRMDTNGRFEIIRGTGKVFGQVRCVQGNEKFSRGAFLSSGPCVSGQRAVTYACSVGSSRVHEVNCHENGVDTVVMQICAQSNQGGAQRS